MFEDNHDGAQLMEKSPVVSRLCSLARRLFSLRAAPAAATFGLICIMLSACASGPVPVGPPAKVAPDVLILNPGDVIKLSFPGAPTLDTTQQIRRDGRINLYLIGEVKASEKTPAEFERELMKVYSAQTRSEEIKVTVISSSFAVYIAGAVMRPGKISPERAITAFDAVMEAGGFDLSRADTKHVQVIRQEDGQVKTYPLNMKAVLDGVDKEPFYLKSYDTVYVPEKFSWF